MLSFKKKSAVASPKAEVEAEAFPSNLIAGHHYSAELLCESGCKVCDGVIKNVEFLPSTIQVIDSTEYVLLEFAPEDWRIDEYDEIIEVFVEAKGRIYVNKHSA